MFSRIKHVSTIYAAVIVLFVITAVLAVLNLDTTFAVRRVQITGSESRVDLYNQSFLVDFNHPIQPGQNLNELISIEPSQQLYFSLQGSELKVQTSRALDSASNYKLTVNSKLKDVFDHTLESDFVYEFRSRDLDLYYVQPGLEDKLVRRGMGDQKEEVLFAAPEIVRHYVNGEYLIVITSESFEEQTLHLVNLQTGEIKRPLPSSFSTYEAQFVPEQSLVYLTARVLENNPEVGEIYTSRQLYLMNLNTLTFEKIDLPETIQDLEDILLSPDGQALMFKDTLESIYYLMDVTDTLNPVSLGHFVATGGFNYDSQELIFTAADFVTATGFPFTVKIDSEREQTIITPDGTSVIDPHWSNRESNLLVSRQYEELDNSRGYYELLVLNGGGGEILNVLRKDKMSLEMPQYSPDDKFISIEAYTTEQLTNLIGLRIMGYQAKPAEGEIYLIDTQSLTVQQAFEGVNAIWY